MKKVIFVLIDGLNAETAFRHMGFMEHLVEARSASKYVVRSELPSVSRPLYEVLMTGTPVSVNRICSNETIRKSTQKNLFQMSADAGIATAAAAYYFFSELYLHAPFHPLTDRFHSDSASAIQNAMFYYDDSYPDSHLFLDADELIIRHHPGFILVHPMSVDYIGHQFGGGSGEYCKAAFNVDCILSRFLFKWIEEGYSVIITADHGMGKDGIHGGTSAEERMIPMYILSGQVDAADYSGQTVSQLHIAPLVCKLLGLPLSEHMIEPKIPGLHPAV